jgi:C-terminal processing protease CtpA/Prc
MEMEKFLEAAKSQGKKKGKAVELEKMKKLFERFHVINRKYLDADTYEESQKSIASMADTIARTVEYLDQEVAHLRNKRLKLSFDNLALAEMQKAQARNSLLIKEYMQGAE